MTNSTVEEDASTRQLVERIDQMLRSTKERHLISVDEVRDFCLDLRLLLHPHARGPLSDN